MRIIKEIEDFELKGELWSGAINTVDAIIEQDKLRELMGLLDEIYPDPVDVICVNDLLWHDKEFIYAKLNFEKHVQKRL